MNYVIGDIHNDNIRFSKMLEKIGFSEEDHLFLLGDLFDGREGYISVCGHTNISGDGKIWKNKLENVYVCDCGCGFQYMLTTLQMFLPHYLRHTHWQWMNWQNMSRSG